MKISQSALDCSHRLEEKVFGAKLTPAGRVLACDIIQRAIDLGDRQNENPAFDAEFDTAARYTFENGQWVPWKPPQMELALALRPNPDWIDVEKQ